MSLHIVLQRVVIQQMAEMYHLPVIVILLMVQLLELLPVELVLLLSPQRVMLNTQVLLPLTVSVVISVVI